MATEATAAAGPGARLPSSPTQRDFYWLRSLVAGGESGGEAGGESQLGLGGRRAAEPG